MKRFLPVLALVVSLIPTVALAAPSAVPPPHKSVSDPELLRVIENALPNDGTTFGIAVEGLRTGRTALLGASAEFPAASLFKLGVMYEFYRQKKAGIASVNDVLTETEAEFDDSGTNMVGPPGTQLPAGVVLQYMMTVSDNVAAMMLMDYLGRANVNATLNALGLHSTRIHTFAPGDPIPARLPNYTTAGDMLRFFSLLAGGSAIDPDSNREMMNLLLGDEIRDRLPALLPPDTLVAHKTGDLDGLLNDAGIVYAPDEPYVIVVLSNDIPDVGPPDSLAVGRNNIAQISRAVYDYFEGTAV